VAKFGLDVAVPGLPVGCSGKLAWLLGTFLTQAALGETDDPVIRDLAAASREVAS
jgi:hypothetical protein